MNGAKVLIVSAVPINNGDAALVLGLYKALKDEGLRVKIATYKYETVKALYPEVPFVKDVLDSNNLRRLRVLKYLVIPFKILASKPYREADVILGAPGGYINSYYGFSDKLFVYLVCKMLGKRTAVYSQSIGPLEGKDPGRFAFFMKYIDRLYARDRLSYDTAARCLKDTNKIVITEDAAFLHKPDFRKGKPLKKAAISVRDWSFDGRSREKYYGLVSKLVERCLEQGYAVEFISTCQGMPGYIDDSKTAKIIAGMFGGDANVKVIERAFNLNELQWKLREYDFVIGTRLHMCILSMINGVPAFNISYESKGRECYDYLGLKSISVDYNEDASKASKAFDSFISGLPEIERNVQKSVTSSHEKAKVFLKKFVQAACSGN